MSVDHRRDEGKEPLFSIIMPVFDSEPYLAAAVDSIRDQTCSDWELILIDDASTDGSSSIIEALARRDRRIRSLRNEENIGAAASRNRGMEVAQGRYVWFADSDDTFSEDLLERLRIEIEAHAPQIILFGTLEQYYDADGTLLYEQAAPVKAMHSDDPSEWRSGIIDLERDTNFGYASAKVYLLDFLRVQHVLFEDFLLAEDFAFNVHAFRHARSIAAVEDVYYIYRKVMGRSVTNARSFSMNEYYDLHRMRIHRMRALLTEWDVYDDRAREILGSLYGRYILSALEQSYAQGEKLSRTERKDWLRSVFADELFGELIPVAKSQGSAALDASLAILRSKGFLRCSALGSVMSFTRSHLYTTFVRLRGTR